VTRLSDYDYVLPEAAIAQKPIEPRDASKMLVLNSGAISHSTFRELPVFLKSGDLIIANNTRVSAIRLSGSKATGGQVEALLLREIGDGEYEAMLKPAKRLKFGAEIEFGGDLKAKVTRGHESGIAEIKFENGPDLKQKLADAGTVPLPPYVHELLEDAGRYQTVYACADGSAAAPTAGLHFTETVLDALREKGVDIAYITLDVGIDTFRPLTSEDVSAHIMHGEKFVVPKETAAKVSSARGRILAVGTTAVRALETAAIGERTVAPGAGCSSLFITPGYSFKIVDSMITNFHMPRTTMLLMVSALCGRENLKNAYLEALSKRYRFLSFGDCMLILGG
jgi:S-adenosylmethionine:tRNA ribosyltransferase-isomerase